jgi:uncharacterized protein (TIGR02453 family)
MISKGILDFLKALEKNNNRDWFQQNRSWYEEVKTEFEIVVNVLLHELTLIDSELSTITAKDCIFRIYRDVRFSKDKSPYKNNFGAYFVKGGKKSGFAGYYIHIESGGSFIAGGIHRPSSEILRRVRGEIYAHTDEYKSIIRQKDFIYHFGGVTGEMLKSAPSGFPKDFPEIDLLKFKSYTIIKPVTDLQICDTGFLQEALKTFSVMKRFIAFLNDAIG